MSILGQRRQHRTSWDELGWSDVSGARLSSVDLSDDGKDGPVVMRVEFPPNYRVAPHKHPSDYIEIVLNGSQEIGSQHYTAGDLRIVRADTFYGPITIGPDGCQLIIVFSGSEWKAIALNEGEAAELTVPAPERAQVLS